jgi:hypothetical protein
VKIAKYTSRMTRVFGAASVALALAACAEQKAISPNAKLDVSQGTDFNATVTSKATSYDKGVETQHYQLTQNLKARFGSGIARAMVPHVAKVTAPDDTSAVPTGGEQQIPGLTPVLAVTDSTLAYNYDATETDSAGNVLHIVATGPAGSSQPVTDVTAYVNGVLVVTLHTTWAPAYGGWVLADQTQSAYNPDGSLKAEVYSDLTGSSLIAAHRTLGGRLAALPQKGLKQVICMLSPISAYAASMAGCTKQGLVLIGGTIVLGGASAEPITWSWIYLIGWGLWTSSLYDYLDCVDGQAASANQRKIARGSGTSW